MMFAPANSRPDPSPAVFLHSTMCPVRRNRGLGLAAVALWCLLSTFALLAAEPDKSRDPGALATPVQDPEKAYKDAEAKYRKNPADPEAAWQLGRACFDMADAAKSRQDRARYAEEGIAVTQRACALDTNSAPAHYYLGLNYGQLARTRTITALRLLRPMQEALERARVLEATFDYAGPDRALGMLYRDAPTWSVGDRKRAREHLYRAVKLAPLYPRNHLEVVSAYIQFGEKENARRQLAELESILPKSKAELFGPRWAEAWSYWEKQRHSLRTKLRLD